MRVLDERRTRLGAHQRPAGVPCCRRRARIVSATAAAVAALWFGGVPAVAGDGEATRFGGHVKLQYTYTDFRPDDFAAGHGSDPAHDGAAEVRLKLDRRHGRWRFEAHGEWLAVGGDALAARRAAAALGLLAAGTASGLPDDRRRLFDLSETLSDRPRRAAVARLDRLALGYVGARSSLQFGRQAVSWGNGLVFHPLDFVNPFSPVAIDKEYKTGDDMLYGQWLLGEAGGDLEAIVVPRRDPVTRAIASNQTTYALKWRERRGGFDLDLLAARHFGEDVLGLGTARSLGDGGAVWRLDAVYTGLDTGGSAFSFVTNLDHAWTAFGRNVYGYVEYFRNGVGQGDRSRYLEPSPALAQRLARGECYTLARHYAAFGLRIELDPLVQLLAGRIHNLDDGSRYTQLRLSYDWRQDWRLLAGLDWPAGRRGTEFGGLAVAGEGTYLAPGRAVYLRAAYYF
jgi:hypothetical protein